MGPTTVHGEVTVEQFPREVLERGEEVDAGEVHADVEATEALDGGSHRRNDGRLITYVALNELVGPAAGDVRTHDSGAFVGERRHRGCPDTRRCPGDEAPSPCERPAPAVMLVAGRRTAGAAG
jgi:hypothetical protein